MKPKIKKTVLSAFSKLQAHTQKKLSRERLTPKPLNWPSTWYQTNAKDSYSYPARFISFCSLGDFDTFEAKSAPIRDSKK